jgi:hypothetical protein
MSATRTGLAAGLALSLLGASEARGQATGTLAGRVTDKTGGVISGGRIEAIGPTHRTADTDAAGAYRVPGLTPGSYTVLVRKDRFAPFTAADVRVEAGKVAALDVTLELAPIEETATVEGEKPLGLDPSESAGAIVLRGDDLDALPDDPDEMAEALQALAGPAAGPSGGQMFIDGFSGGRLPPKGSIREIRLNMNPFSAEYDRLGFGRIEILTKPGTDRVRGGASFEFMDGTLNSRNPFASNRPPYQRRDWAGNLGAPLSKKASFFVDFERRDIDDNELINATVLGPSLEPVALSLAVLAPQHRTTVSPRLDWQIGSKHTLVARYAFLESGREKAGIGGFSLPERAYDSTHEQDTFQLTDTWVLSSRVANETRVQYDRERSRRQGDNSVPTIQVPEAFTGGGSPVGRSHNDEDRIEVHNVTTWSRGKHSVRAGMRLRGVRSEDLSDNNFGGTVTFAGGLGPLLDAGNRVVLGPDGQPVRIALTNLERYRRTLLFQRMGLSAAEIRARGGGATQLRIAGGNPEAAVRQWDVAPFVQDDWKASSNFTLSLGLRYENQTNIRSDGNFAPRLAFAFSPHRGDEQPRTVVRGGLGVFYERFGEDLTLQARRFDGINQQQFVVSTPAVLDRLEFTGDTVLGLPSTAELSGFALPQNTRVVAPGLQAPRTVQASLSFEQLLPGNVTFSVVAVSTGIRRMLRSRNITAPDGGERPRLRSDTVYQYESTGRFDQEQLILGLNSRTSRTVTLFARYFLGRARSDTDGAGSFPADSNDLAAEYGPAALDVRHRFTLGGSVRLPGSVRVHPFVVYSSGAPFNITTGRDNNGDTLFTDRPALATDPSKPGVVQTPWGLLDPDPERGQATIARNRGRGPSFLVVNLRVGKTIGFGKRPEGRAPEGGDRPAPPGTSAPPIGPGRDGEGRGGGRRGRDGGDRGGGDRAGGDRAYRGLRERSEGRVTLTFSLNAHNVLNHVNAGPPVGNLGSPLFGRSVATAGGFGAGGGTAAGNRRIELQARLAF